jgi:hypothetical protein
MFRDYPIPDPALLRIQDAVQIERRRRHRGLAQHDVYLPAMVRLVIEKMTASHVRRIHAVATLVVRISERTAPKSGIEPREEQLDSRVFPLSRVAQAGKIVVQNPV